MPAKSEKQRKYAAMSATKKGRAKLAASGKKPMPVKTAKKYRKKA